jgi:hypothetical protein
MTAPGMIGCIAGMNAQGLGAGVDMSPSGNCDPSRPGFNSTLLVRHSIENGKDCDQAVAIMEEAQRGVSWNYILAHYGDNDHHRACVVEAGCKMDDPDFSALISKYLQEHVLDLSYDHVPDQLALRLPERSFLEAPKPPEFRKGLMVRWNDYVYPETYLELNRGLFQLFGREYDPDDFMERGYIVDSWEEKHIPRRKRVPYGYYFAPQREHDAHLVLVTNMYIIPEMRLFAMHPWTNLLAASHYDNLQWRYDELNNELLDRLEDANQPLSLEEAKDAIDFLSPNPQKKNHDYYDPKPTSTCCQRLWHRLCRKFPGRHRPDPKSDHWKHIQVHGSVSLMDLKNKVIYSHYGYHGDEWVHISLKEYVDDSPEKTGV